MCVIEESNRDHGIDHILDSVPGMLLSQETYHIRLSSITGSNRAKLYPQPNMKKILINKQRYLRQSP